MMAQNSMLCVGKSPRLGPFPKGLGPCDSQYEILGTTIPLFFLSGPYSWIQGALLIH